MISQTAEYALRAAVVLGASPMGSMTTGQIAAAARVPAGYLSKILRSLSKAGIVEAKRGQHGGFALCRPLDELTILELIQAVDEWKRIERCPLGLDEHAGGLCPLHRRLDDVIAQIEAVYGRTTIGELIGGTRGSGCTRLVCHKGGSGQETGAEGTSERA